MSRNSVSYEKNALGKMRVSLVIPTYNRVGDLEITLKSILEQSLIPLETIIVDDSSNDRTEALARSLGYDFKLKSSNLIYIRNPGERGNTIAKNLGAANSKGDVVLFLDDDVTLDQEYVREMLRVYEDYPQARGVQGYWAEDLVWDRSLQMRNLFNRLFFLWHYRKDSCIVQASFWPTYPFPLTRVINCQWLSGCNHSYLKSVLSELRFDEKLRRYSPGGEEVDFSFRVHKKYPDSLFMTLRARLIHRASPVSRTPDRNLAILRAVYLEYFFFKNIDQTHGNRLVYGWSKTGRIVNSFLVDFHRMVRTKNPGIDETRNSLVALVLCHKYRNNIRERDLEFLNPYLKY